jgi:hypothetical protein
MLYSSNALSNFELALIAEEKAEIEEYNINKDNNIDDNNSNNHEDGNNLDIEMDNNNNNNSKKEVTGGKKAWKQSSIDDSRSRSLEDYRGHRR